MAVITIQFLLMKIFEFKFQKICFLEKPQVRRYRHCKHHISQVHEKKTCNNKLNVVLPANGNYLSTTQLFNHASLKTAKWKDVDFDVFCLHSRWNKDEIMKVLREETRTFTIVRDPVEVFVSMFHFQDPVREFYGVKDIHEMVNLIQNTSASALNKRWLGFVGRNQMAWDMGLSPDIFEDTETVTKEIERLDSEFDLVMVAHRMDESLILLRHLLNWPLQNVIHLNLNRRRAEKRLPSLSTDERKVLTAWLAADVQIFEYFSRRFDERVAQFNQQQSSFLMGNLFNFNSPMKIETQLLRKANKELYKRCVLQEVANEKLTGKFKEHNNNIVGFIINEEKQGCDLYAMSEPAYLKLFEHLLLSRISNTSTSNG
ncbi:galactosylceramide sulfotransferase-like [Daphnia carinata]|uniref:galactosylceramide sulfotransferase-like n=1 Tax=Daphnia carinata TaxID=120202 RepID=UPI002868EAE4|nr:galactosylceramide sulfotransferase-like [Daphnia carinata]